MAGSRQTGTRVHSRCRFIPMLPVAIVVLSAMTSFCSALEPGRATIPKQALPQCRAVSLSASYLAQISPHEGPGFLIQLRNATLAPFLVPLPVPLSVHWYATSGSGWVWRASSGVGGGALLDALHQSGPVFAAAEPASLVPLEVRLVAPGETFAWTASFQQRPTLRYMPGCEHCNYPRGGEYRAVLSYALLPGPYGQETSWLSCGLRSNPVDMPPVSDLR